MINPTSAAALGPESLSAWMRWLQFSSTPRLELVTHCFRLVPWSRNNDVDMIRSGSSRMKCPTTNFAVFRKRVLDDSAVI